MITAQDLAQMKRDRMNVSLTRQNLDRLIEELGERDEQLKRALEIASDILARASFSDKEWGDFAADLVALQAELPWGKS